MSVISTHVDINFLQDGTKKRKKRNNGGKGYFMLKVTKETGISKSPQGINPESRTYPSLRLDTWGKRKYMTECQNPSLAHTAASV